MTQPGLSAGAVAQRLGVAVTTLRSWHARYGLGPSGHQTGRHRRYTEADVDRLQTMLRLTGRGVPAARAARMVTADSTAAQALTAATPGAQVGGGRTVPVGRAGPAARGLARAASRLDSPAMLATIAQAIGTDGVVTTWETLIRPVLAGIGVRHADTNRLVEVEHLLSRCITETLIRVPRPAGGVPRVLLGCAQDEQHSLPLEALAAALAERGVASRLLGARVPWQALRDAVRRTGPRVVVVWSHDRATADVDQLAKLLIEGALPALAAAGPGWSGVRLPDGVSRPTGLAGAVELILGAVGWGVQPSRAGQDTPQKVTTSGSQSSD